MIAELKPYPRYQDSAVPWLGDIPAHWQRSPGRACFAEKKTANVGMQETTVLSLSYGQIVVKPPEKLHGLVPASFETYQIIEPDDIVIRPTDLQNDWVSLRTGLARTRGIITSAYMRLRAKDLLAPEYGHLLLHGYDLKKVFYGLGSGLRQNLSWRDFKYLPCLVPPPDEQAAIARFLDHIDRRTRCYIRAKKKMIALLEEQKQAIIQRAVTHGLNSNVRLKPSGVEWLGEIPEHWQVRPLKQLCTGSALYGANAAATSYTMAGVRFLRTTDITEEGGLKKGGVFLPQDSVLDYMLTDGDLLISRSGTIGRSFLYSSRDHGPCAYAGYLVRFVPGANVFPKYLFLFTKTHSFAGFLRVMAISSTIENVNGQKYANARLSVPPLSEQAAIVGFLDHATAAINRATAAARREIDLIREYHTRLIADVVTGKLDVRQAAASLPDEAEEPDDWDADEAEEESDEDMDEADVEANDEGD